MLYLGFQEEINMILAGIPHTFQTCLLSDSLDQQTLAFADNCMKNPVRILIKKKAVDYGEIIKINNK